MSRTQPGASRISIAALAVALVFFTAAAAHAILCDTCRNKVFDNQFGTCRYCKEVTHSTWYQVCPHCSVEKRVCECCNKPVGERKPKPGEFIKIDYSRTGLHQSGRWMYRFEHTEGGANPAVRGRLAYDGKELPMANFNDHYETPWGFLYWNGGADNDNRRQGWLPTQPPGIRRKGARLEPPSGGNKEIALTLADNGRRIQAVPGARIKVTLEGRNTSGNAWRVDSLSGTAVQAVSRRPQFQLKNPADRGGEGIYRFDFKAVATGTATLKMTYGRAGGAYGTPQKAFFVILQVAE